MKTEIRKCGHCEAGRRRELVDGVLMHYYKQSNGYDYDNYHSPCEDQTAAGLAAYRKEAMLTMRNRIKNHTSALEILQATARTIKKTKSAFAIEAALNRTELV
jgi:hypothetical protein